MFHHQAPTASSEPSFPRRFTHAASVVPSFRNSSLPTSVIVTVGGVDLKHHRSVRLTHPSTLQPLGFACLSPACSWPEGSTEKPECVIGLPAPSAPPPLSSGVSGEDWDDDDDCVYVLVYSRSNRAALLETDMMRRLPDETVPGEDLLFRPFRRKPPTVPAGFAASDHRHEMVDLDQELRCRMIWNTPPPPARASYSQVGVVLRDDGDPSVDRSLAARAFGKCSMRTVGLELRDLWSGKIVASEIPFGRDRVVNSKDYAVFSWFHDRLGSRLFAGTDDEVHGFDLTKTEHCFTTKSLKRSVNPHGYEIFSIEGGRPKTESENMLFVGAERCLSLIDLRSLSVVGATSPFGYVTGMCCFGSFLAALDELGLVMHDVRKFGDELGKRVLRFEENFSMGAVTVTKSGKHILSCNAGGRLGGANACVTLSRVGSSLDSFKVERTTNWAASSASVAFTPLDDKFGSGPGRHEEEGERLAFVGECPFVTLGSLRCGKKAFSAPRCFLSL